MGREIAIGIFGPRTDGMLQALCTWEAAGMALQDGVVNECGNKK